HHGVTKITEKARRRHQFIDAEYAEENAEKSRKRSSQRRELSGLMGFRGRRENTGRFLQPPQKSAAAFTEGLPHCRDDVRSLGSSSVRAKNRTDRSATPAQKRRLRDGSNLSDFCSVPTTGIGTTGLF